MKPLVLVALTLYFCRAPVMGQHFVLTYQHSDFLFKLSIDSTLSPDSVNYNLVVRSITIRRKSSHKVIQIIYPEDNYPPSGLPNDQLFIIEDVNFDGAPDIRLLQFEPADPNEPYYFWVYDRKTGKFKRFKALEDITSPRFVPEKKLIYSFWRSGCCDHGLSSYKYINGIPVMIREDEDAMSANDTATYIITVKKRINGKMKLVKRTIEKYRE